MPKSLSHPYAILTLTALIWGANAVAGKLAVGHVSPMVLTLLRWALASLVLLPFAVPRLREDWPLVRPKLPFLIVLGAFGFTGFNALFYLALTHTSALNVVIEQSSMPLLVFALSFLVFRTPITRYQVAGFATSFVGVALTASHGDPRMLLALDLNFGDALALVAVVLYAGFTVGLRLKPQVHWLSLILVLSLSALATSVPLAVAEIVAGDAIAPDLVGLSIVVFTAILPSIVSQSLYIRGVEMIGANRANLFINLTPIFGAILAVLILDEEPHLYHVVSLSLVLAGIMLAERKLDSARPSPS